MLDALLVSRSRVVNAQREPGRWRNRHDVTMLCSPDILRFSALLRPSSRRLRRALAVDAARVPDLIYASASAHLVKRVLVGLVAAGCSCYPGATSAPAGCRGRQQSHVACKDGRSVPFKMHKGSVVRRQWSCAISHRKLMKSRIAANDSSGIGFAHEKETVFRAHGGCSPTFDGIARHLARGGDGRD